MALNVKFTEISYLEARNSINLADTANEYASKASGIPSKITLPFYRAGKSF